MNSTKKELFSLVKSLQIYSIFNKVNHKPFVVNTRRFLTSKYIQSDVIPEGLPKMNEFKYKIPWQQNKMFIVFISKLDIGLDFRENISKRYSCDVKYMRARKRL